jgi:hypothetical protein
MMRQLEISLAMQAKIENSWTRLGQEDWLLIEEKALELLTTADLAVTVYLSPLVYRSLAGYIVFEESQMDHAVFEAYFWVLGRPAFAGQWSRRDTETFHFEDSVEEMETPESPLPAFAGKWWRRDTETFHFEDSVEEMQTPKPPLPAFARQRTRRDIETFHLDDSIEIIHTPKPPSSPLLSSRPKSRLRTLQRRHLF